jgi:hypothetical protein
VEDVGAHGDGAAVQLGLRLTRDGGSLHAGVMRRHQAHAHVAHRLELWVGACAADESARALNERAPLFVRDVGVHPTTMITAGWLPTTAINPLSALLALTVDIVIAVQTPPLK